MKALVGAFNQEKALVGAFSVIVQLHQLIVYSTTNTATKLGTGSLAWLLTNLYIVNNNPYNVSPALTRNYRQYKLYFIHVARHGGRVTVF